MTPIPGIVERNPVNKGLKNLLNSNAVPRSPSAPDRFEISKAPETIRKDDDGRLIDGYGIIYPLTSPLAWGSLQHPEDVLTASYQVTCHGRTDTQAQRLQDLVFGALIGRAPSGAFLHPILASPMTVIERRFTEAGTLEEGPGGLWQVPYVYDMEVQAIAP